jgi:hypothetical protein
VLLSPAHRPGDYRRGSAATYRAGAPIVIAFLLFAIVAVIFWPLALIIGLGWVALLILRICFGITVLGIKAVAATGIGAKMLHDNIRDSRSFPGNY